MPVYASTPSFADHRRHPKALLFIVGGHAVLVAAVMTAKMEIVPPIGPTKTIVDLIKAPPEPLPPPPPSPPETRVDKPIQPPASQIDRPIPIRDIPISDGPEIAVNLPILPTPGPIGTGSNPVPSIPVLDPVRVAAVFNTPDYLLRPPYPADKQRLEEEATLKLRLRIDERGRVVAVEPVGPVDRSFFESARKHLIAKWRYKPATVDGRPVATSTTITLRFELET